VIHGYYQTWRLGGRAAEMKTALLEDRRNKHGDTMHETGTGMRPCPDTTVRANN
jgi:hypothetical protein